MENNSFKLSDTVISQIQTCLQMAILSGTDVVDNFRMLRLVANGDVLELDPEYTKVFKENIEKMLGEVEQLEEGNELV